MDVHRRAASAPDRGSVDDAPMWSSADAAADRRDDDPFRAVFESAPDAMLILDDTRAIVHANRASQRLFATAGEELIVLRMDRFVDNAEELGAVWKEMLALGEAFHDHVIVPANGDRRVVQCSYRARVRPGRHLCVARDTTEQRMLRERLQESEKIEVVGRLAGGIAHDFNNLLTAVLGYTELLLAGRGANDPERADLEEIQKAGQRGAALTRQLLAFSRKQVLLPKTVDLNEALVGCRGILERAVREDIAVAIECAPTRAFVRIDPDQLQQALLNLVLNARDAIPADGRITLAVDRAVVEETGVAGARVPPGRYVRLSVSDTGVGMAPEVRAHLFEPFFTTKELGKGTGLGLASVYGIVRQSNAFIGVDTEPGKGTTFSMYFAEALATRDEARPVVSHDPATILLVEDEDAVRGTIAAVLRRTGYSVFEAAGPGEALRIFEEQRDRVALLLTDVVMPEMNGPALAQRLVTDHPHLRVLFISGYADVAARAVDTDNPNTAFLIKPFAASVLVDRVREILARPRPGGGAQ